MQFSINSKLFELFPEYKVGVLVVENLQVPTDLSAIEKQVAVANRHPIDLSSTRVTEWVAAFSQLGLDPDTIKPAHVALLHRLHKGGSLPDVNPLINLLNSYSVQHQIPIGAHALDTLTEDIVVRPAQTGDSYQPMNATTAERTVDGMVYASGSRVLTKNLIWRQGETSKITASTRNILIPIDTLGSISEAQLLDHMKEVKALMEQLFSATVQMSIVSRSNPYFRWNSSSTPLDPKERETLQVLSRGVSEILPSREGLLQLMNQRPIRVYLGIDPTGAFLTLGHSVVLRKLQQFAQLGHDVILLIGNGTVKIGDPTGRDSTRPVLTDEQIEENFKDWQAQASKILDFSKIRIVRNGDWLNKLTYADMVKLMAKTTVQQLMERDMFQDRLTQGLPIHGHEIIYPLLQGYDSVVMDVDLEIGGTDQTFNMMMGRTLQKSYNNHEKWVLTTPIINGTDGRKMSKSYGNYVALTEAPNDMYGKLMSIADDMIIEYFTVLTDVSTEEIQEMSTHIAAGENPMVFKKRLAFVITEMYHDTQAAQEAETFFEGTVQGDQIPDDLPTVSIPSQALPLLELLTLIMPEESRSNLRRLIEQGAVELLPAQQKPTNPTDTIDPTQVEVVRIGKRRYFALQTL